MTRRTQAERKAATVATLIDATIDTLAQAGYASASVRAICRRAGVSQGALFRHFPTRLDIIEATAAAIGARHLAAFEAAFVAGVDVAGMLRFIASAARSDTHAAWHELMVAARTDPALRPAMAAALEALEQAVLGSVARWLGLEALGLADPARIERVGLIVLSILHIYDSEAVTSRIHPNPPLLARRLTWLEGLLRAELG